MKNLAKPKDDEVTPTIPPKRYWWVSDPDGGDLHVVSGPQREPPICEPCAKTPGVMPEGSQRQCGGCGRVFTPADDDPI